MLTPGLSQHLMNLNLIADEKKTENEKNIAEFIGVFEHGSNMRMYYGTRFFVVLCQVLLRNKIYNTQRQKIIQL